MTTRMLITTKRARIATMTVTMTTVTKLAGPEVDGSVELGGDVEVLAPVTRGRERERERERGREREREREYAKSKKN